MSILGGGHWYLRFRVPGADSGQKQGWGWGSLWSWAFESGGKSFKPTILRTHLSSRCVKLQSRFACNMIGKELKKYPLLLKELEDHLLEVEENFVSGGYHKNYVDLKLEHARIKR